ncbi:hypothetical protein [Collimonas sp.]|jgi:hypothetical protein|uniref:hypothetical protein n=1 Tax=Collimonas sp. TaxID=1963772 RepID=UPI002CE4ED6D|nr:hypothetical protein [Collimonas sp.]HWW04218.1 hypothetical protein [Collimonas sp.]
MKRLSQSLEWSMTRFLIAANVGLFGFAVIANAMEVEVRLPFVLLSGPVVGIEARVLEDVIEKNPGITTVILKNSKGGDANAGYMVGELIREHGLDTALSGYCMSSCSRMFLGGTHRSFSDDQPLEKTFVAFHGNYADDGRLLTARMPGLKKWILKYSDGKANPQLVQQWVDLQNHSGFAYFYHQQAKVRLGPEKVMLCQGTEEPKARAQQCEKPEFGDALSNGIVTTWVVLQTKLQDAGQSPDLVINHEEKR